MHGPWFQPGRWTERLFASTERTFAWDGETDEAFDDWQRDFREALSDVLGLTVIREGENPPAQPKVLEEVPEADHTRVSYTLETEAGFHVPYYLLLPDGVEPPLPVVMALHGHGHLGKETYAGRFETSTERPKIEHGERDIGIQAVQRGYAAIVPDMRGFHTLSAHADFTEGSHSCRTMQMHAQLFGRTLVGGRVWDVQRLLDVVEQDDRLDPSRIAVTGNSGGGTVSLFSGAIDERIDVVAPASYFCSFQASIGSIHHCECNYIPGLLRLGEMWDVAGLVAPRPFIAINGREDDIFPIDATRHSFERLSALYEANQAEDRCELHIGHEGHRYYKDPAWTFIESYI